MNKEDKHNKERDLTFLQENCTYIFQLLVTVKELRDKYIRLLNPGVAKLINSSIVRNYLSCIANLLDPLEDNQGNENISIRVIDGIDLDPYKELIKRIRTYRSKAVAHNDRSVMRQGDDYFTNYNLKPEEVEKLFEFMLVALETELRYTFPREQVRQDIQNELARLFSTR